MAEYIEREAVIRALTLHDCDSAGAKMAIYDLPAADVAPVRHGRWVKRTKDCVYFYACSECGEPVLRSLWGNDFFSDFCPNCGARMDDA